MWSKVTVSVEWSMQKALVKPHNRMKIITRYDLFEKLKSPV